jgi:LPS-assembly protein
LLPLVIYASTDKMSIANRLGWIVANNPYNRCKGYYKELPIKYKPNPLVSNQQDNFNIIADTITYKIKGQTALKGNVRATQPGQEITAKSGYLYPDKKTNKMKTLKLVGNVHAMQPNNLLLADKATIDLKNNISVFENAHYREVLASNTNTEQTDKDNDDNTQHPTQTQLVKNPLTNLIERRIYQITAWGNAKKITKKTKKHLTILEQATMSTCAPNTNTWAMKASELTFDTGKQKGSAKNVRFTIKDIPVLYSPYISFPLDKKRKTGFLLPSYGTTDTKGFTIQLPFYWNIAPNYDATITPQYMTKRGVLWDGLFRYLTSKSTGELRAGVIFGDSEFPNFQQEAKSKYSDQPTLDELENNSNNRYSLSWQDHTDYNSNWYSDLDFNYISDDYFIQDLSDDLINNSENQLLQQFQLNFNSDHWNFYGNLQRYQTLHPVNQDEVANQYAKLPQLQLNTDYPDQIFGLDFALNSEFVLFTKNKNPYENTSPTTGNRFNIDPSISLPLYWSYANLTPRIQLETTKYFSHNLQGNHTANPGLMAPIIDVHGHLYFDRSTTLFGKKLRQTLEPELYYLYVPYHNQDYFPAFDVSDNTFDYDQMFQDNRFSSVDRIGDANQITLAMTTRFIDDDTGEEKANASIGQIYYFQQRRVVIDPNLISDEDKEENKQYISPIAAKATYNLNTHWSATLNLTWNLYRHGLENQEASLEYKKDDQHLIELNYHFLRNGDALTAVDTDNPKNDLNQTDIAGYWQLTNHWSFMGRWNYNWSHGHNQAYYFGLSYESCCWAARFVFSRAYSGTDPYGKIQFDQGFYFQFALKGLGAIGDTDVETTIEGSLDNYADVFGKYN